MYVFINVNRSTKWTIDYAFVGSSLITQAPVLSFENISSVLLRWRKREITIF